MMQQSTKYLKYGSFAFVIFCGILFERRFIFRFRELIYRNIEFVKSFLSYYKNGISSDNQSEADKNAPKTEEGLVLDRPFIYAVVDNESYLPVIIGTVSNL